MSDMEKRIEALEQRLKFLEAQQGILQTMNSYAHAIDYGLPEEWLDLFTKDAHYFSGIRGIKMPEIFGIPQPEDGFSGEDLSAYIHMHDHVPEAYHKHFIVEPVIKLEGEDKASATTYFARLDNGGETGPFVLCFGRYLDKYVKCEDGKWRFKERRIDIESMMGLP